MAGVVYKYHCEVMVSARKPALSAMMMLEKEAPKKASFSFRLHVSTFSTDTERNSTSKKRYPIMNESIG